MICLVSGFLCLCFYPLDITQVLSPDIKKGKKNSFCLGILDDGLIRPKVYCRLDLLIFMHLLACDVNFGCLMLVMIDEPLKYSSLELEDDLLCSFW